YVNLTTARSAERAREIGVRKISGAGRKQIIFQFMGEAVLVSVLAFLIALAALKLFHPLFARFGGGSLYSGFELDGLLIFAGIALAVLLGAATGYFPAMVISRFDPARAMKAGYNPGSRKGGIRKVLVILQFSISIVLIFGTIVIYRQMTFVQNKKLGYEKDHIVVLNVGYPDFLDRAVLLKEALTSDAGVLNASIVSQLPADILTAEYIDFGEDREEGVHYISVDKDFFETAGIRVIRGAERIAMQDGPLPADQASVQNRFVINQAALEMMGLTEDEAVGEMMSIRHGNMKPGTVIGVVEDFHFQSLHNPIRPLVFEFDPFDYEFILVKIDSRDVPSTMSRIRGRWEQIAGDIPFD
ncbi:MAG TPA: FtsX-like permease family protein, partial [Candidatus Krumholzibacterium sp.]|nr:FtsX-like permease family protein [Candidatus Krumholzibacterium sp.]